MQVILNEKEYEYLSDYPDGWKFISKDHFKSPVVIGNLPLFVKRFPVRSTPLAGLQLMQQLCGKNEKYLPKIYDLVEVPEGKKTFTYVFTECLQGMTLNKILEQSIPVDLATLTKNILTSLKAIHKYNYWFPDFTERNIFLEREGKFMLIDLDSCEQMSTAPDKDMDVSKDYWVLVFNYYRDVLKVEMLLQEFPGKLLNYLQVIFLAFHIKQQTATGGYTQLSDQAFTSLPSELNKVDPAIRNIFSRFLKNKDDEAFIVPFEEIENIILNSIIGSGTTEKVQSAPPVIDKFDLQDRKDAKSLLVAKNFISRHGPKIIAIALVPTLIWWLIPAKEKALPVVVSRIAPRMVERNYTLVIQGENFPKKDDPLQVLINKKAAQLIYNSRYMISAVVPDLGQATDGARVMVELVINGDTSLASNEIVFRHH